MSVTRTILKSSGPHDYNKSYKKYSVVDHTIDNVTKTYLAISNVPQRVSILDEHYWQEIPSGGDGTVDYDNLINKPTINGVELDGNKTSEDLGVYSKPSSGIPQSDLSPNVQAKLNNHFKGWYASEDTLPSNPVVGDYAYVKGAESTDPAAIYECIVAGSWSDSERTVDTNNVQIFETGEKLNEVGIDDEPIAGSDNLVKSGSVAELIDTTENVELGQLEMLPYRIGDDGIWTGQTSLHVLVSVSAGDTYFIQTKTIGTKIAFLTDKTYVLSENAPFVDNTSLDYIQDNTARYVKIPENCNYLYFQVFNDSCKNFPILKKITLDVNKKINKYEGIWEDIDISACPLLSGYITFNYDNNGRTQWIPKQSTNDIVSESLGNIPPENSNIGAYATFRESATYKMVSAKIPDNTDYVKIRSNKTYPTYYTFLTYLPTSTTRDVSFANNVYRVNMIEADTEAEISIPSDASYFLCYVGRVVANATYTTLRIYEPSSIQFHKSFKDVLDGMLNVIGDNISNNIFSFNRDGDIEPRCLALRKAVRHSSVMSSESVVFGHISDCHGTGDATSQSYRTWKRAMSFLHKWKEKGYIDDIVDTGDIVSANWSDTLDWRVDATDVLTIIGNHDSSIATGSGVERWLPHIGVDCYERYIATNVTDWNVNQPSDAAIYGKCYYYKDYVKNGYNESITTKSNLTIRAIYLDVMGWGYGESVDIISDAQKIWLEGLLSDAITNNYSVVIFAHYPPIVYKRIDCQYSSLARGIAISPSFDVGSALDYNIKYAIVGKMIHDYQVSGGVFLGYVCGHVHYDCIGQISGKWDFTPLIDSGSTPIQTTSSGENVVDFDNELYPQMVFSVGSGNVSLKNNLYDYRMIANTETNDNFQLISFNAYNKSARVCKIGCKIDVHMRKKDTIEVFTGPINTFDPNNVSYTEGTKVEKDGIIYRLIKLVVINNQTSWESSVKEISSRINL